MNIPNTKLLVIAAVVIVIIVIVAVAFVYLGHTGNNNKTISPLENASISGVKENLSNASFLLTFSNPNGIEPNLLEFSASTGNYSAFPLKYNDFSGNHFYYFDANGLPGSLNVQNKNDSSTFIYSGAIITVNSWNVPEHAFTKYGITLSLTYNGQSGPAATLNPVTMTGNFAYIKSYTSTAPDGATANVTQLALTFSPSVLSFLDFSVTLSNGSSLFLEPTTYTTSSTWPSYQLEATYLPNGNYSVPSNIQAYTSYVNGSMGTEVSTNTFVYLVGFNGYAFSGAHVALSSEVYVGNISFTVI